MKLKNTSEKQFRQAVRVAARKGAAMQRKLVESICSNCSTELKDSALAVLDGNPKHQRLCLGCMKKIIIPPNVMIIEKIVYLQSTCLIFGGGVAGN